MAVVPEINKINENIARFADGKKIRYVNINDKLADKNGVLFDGMTVDKLHPTREGLSDLGRRAEADPHRAARPARVDRPGAAADRRSEREKARRYVITRRTDHAADRGRGRKRFPALCLGLALQVAAPNASAQTWSADNGNGTYSNPLFYDEFSDPDLIRVGRDYYLTGTTMHAMPGLPVLHSTDLVNWEFMSYALDRLTSVPSSGSRMDGTFTARGSGRRHFVIPSSSRPMSRSSATIHRRTA